MAEHVVRALDVTVNSVDLTTKVRSANLTVTTNNQQYILMTQNWQNRLPADMDWNVSVTYVQDYATGSVDATHWALVSALSTFTIKVLPSGSAAAGNNPEYSGTVSLGDYVPVDGTKSEVHEVTVTYEGTGALTRAVA